MELVDIHFGAFSDDDLYIALELLKFLDKHSKNAHIFSIERTPQFYLESDLNKQIEYLLEHIFGLEFKLVCAENIEYEIFPTDEDISTVSNYIDKQSRCFSKDPKNEDLSTFKNVPKFSIHMDTISQILEEKCRIYGNEFFLSEVDVKSVISDLLFVHPLIYLWQTEVIKDLEISVENNPKTEIEQPVFSAKITLDKNFGQKQCYSAVSDIAYNSGVIFYKGFQTEIKLPRTEQRLCEYLYGLNKDVSKSNKNDCMQYVYQDSVIDNSERFKKVLSRLNKKLKEELQLDINPAQVSDVVIIKKV